MKTPVVDFSFIYELSGNDKAYVYEVIKLYLDTMPSGLEKLEHFIRKTNDYEAIHAQAHFLKSSASVVKIKDMYDSLIEIDILGRQHTGKDEMIVKLDHILANFKEAYPLILAEKEKCKPVKSKAKK